MPVVKSDQATGESGGTEVSSAWKPPWAASRARFGNSPASSISRVNV
jgi:hypothetical protein